MRYAIGVHRPKSVSIEENTMYYNPNRVSRIERQAFQLVGDKADQKVRTRQAMTAAERDCYWTTAIRKAMQVVRHDA